MSRIISNCPVKKLCNISLNIKGVFKRINDCIIYYSFKKETEEKFKNFLCQAASLENPKYLAFQQIAIY